MIFLLAAAVGYAVHRLLRWAIRRDALELAILVATLDGQSLLISDRFERGEEHLLPKARRGG